MSLRDNDLVVGRVFEDVLQKATSETYETVMRRDRSPVSLGGINSGRSAACRDRDLSQSLFGEVRQHDDKWYCPSCGFGPLDPRIDTACPNCDWFPGRGRRGMLLGIVPAEVLKGERSRNACGAGAAVGNGGLRRGTDDMQCNWG